MARHLKTEHGRLTEYEEQQVRQIAEWKSLPPHPLAEIWKTITVPVAKALERVIPDRLAEFAIEKLDDGASLLAGQEDIKRRAGVADLAELRDHPLEECDRMARQTGWTADLVGMAEGAATGAGGVWTTLLDIPLLFGLALRTIRKIGHCYGYPLEGREGRAFVLGALVTALSGSLEIRRERLQRLRDVEDLVIEETEEDILVEEVVSFLFQLEVFEDVPGIGAISGAILNAGFMIRIESTARRVFQERWLRDTGKVDEIEPAEAPAHMRAPGLAGAFGRLAYSGIYSAGYVATVPVYAAAVITAPVTAPIARGIGRAAGDVRSAAASLVQRRRSTAAVPA